MIKTYFIGRGQGTSMQPIINEGDKLFVEKVKLKDLRVGDIVVFYISKNLVGHRIIKIRGNQILTKGDNVPAFDKPITANNILGKVIRIEGKYGKIDLTTRLSKVITTYFLFYSLTTYHLPLWIRANLPKLLRGRKILTQCLVLLNFSAKYPSFTNKRSTKRNK